METFQTAAKNGESWAQLLSGLPCWEKSGQSLGARFLPSFPSQAAPFSPSLSFLLL